MTAAMRDFLVKFGAALAASGLMSFFGAFLGMYVLNSQQNSSIVNIERDMQRHDVRIERLETRSEAQGKELAKLSMLVPMVEEMRGDIKKILPMLARGQN